MLPAEGIDLCPETGIQKPKGKGDRGIEPPFPPEPAGLAALRIMAPGKTVKDDQDGNEAKKDQSDISLFNQGKQDIKGQIQEYNLNDKKKSLIPILLEMKKWGDWK